MINEQTDLQVGNEEGKARCTRSRLERRERRQRAWKDKGSVGSKEETYQLIGSRGKEEARGRSLPGPIRYARAGGKRVWEFGETKGES